MWFFAAALVLMLVSLEFLLGWHTLACAAVAVSVLLGPLAGIRPTAASVVCAALFLVSFRAVQVAGTHQRRSSASPMARRKLAAASGKWMAAVLAVALLVALPAGIHGAEPLWNAAYAAEGLVFRTARQQDASRPVTGGAISRSNNYRTGTEHLFLRADRHPTEPLYLRGFSGGDWASANDEEIFRQMSTAEAPPGSAAWRSLESRISSAYYSMYFLLNQATDQERVPLPISLTLRHSGGSYDTRYVPYYSTSSWGWNSAEGYRFLLYEQGDMHIDWEALPPRVDSNWYWISPEEYAAWYRSYMEWYHWMQDTYMEAIQSAYTQVPEDLLPRLTALCRAYPLEDPEDITAFILYTLHSRATYTLTPGWFPVNTDVVDAFVFDVGRGYCQHFAAAATLMYRLYGIPARYATGYRVSPDAFVQQENGAWTASVTDESAHAWVEIFLEDYGWTPVEVTPADDGSAAVSYPGFDTSLLAQLTTEHGWSLEASDPSSNTQAAAGTDASLETSLLPALSIDWSKHRDLLVISATCAACLVCLSPLLLDYRRLRRLKKLEQAGCRAVFGRLLALLRFAGLPGTPDGTEDDFPRLVASVAPGVKAADVAQVQRIVTAAAFGPSAPSPEEEALVWRVYTQAAGAVRTQLTPWKRALFRFWHAFG